jgi:hypothetical protein
MRTLFGSISLAVILSALSLARGDDKAPAKKTEAREDKSEAKDKLVPIGALVGRLTRVEGAQRNLVIQVGIPYLGPGLRLAQRNIDIELQPTDDMKVRTFQLPPDFDEKGRPKKYSAKELKELKGPDPKLPGYTADFDSLKADQIVKVFLARKKGAKASPRPQAPRKKGKEDNADAADAKADNRPEVTMVLILAEPRK